MFLIILIIPHVNKDCFNLYKGCCIFLFKKMAYFIDVSIPSSSHTGKYSEVITSNCDSDIDVDVGVNDIR